MIGDNPIIGILHPGDMGAAVAETIRDAGFEVVAAVAGRSDDTRQRCGRAGIVMLDSLEELVRRSNVVLSLVPPACAEQVADAYCDLAHVAPPGAVFADVNSIRPELAIELGERIESHGVMFVDAAINGLAKNLRTSGTLFVSGRAASGIEAIFDGRVRVQNLGDIPGRASAMKMLLAGLSKGICGLFAELALLARQRGMSADFLDAANRIYPGVMQLIDRMLPTYALHAQRRATEMHELVETARASALDPCVLDAIRQLHDAIAGIEFSPGTQPGNVTAFIDQLAAGALLRCETVESTEKLNRD